MKLIVSRHETRKRLGSCQHCTMYLCFFYIMNTNIRKILNDKYGLFEKDINILLEKFTRLSLKKKETILQEGQADHYIYFVEKGIVKSTIFREGREFIVFFALENEVPFSSPDLIHSGQSLYTLETIDDCILWRISRKDLADLFGTSINLSNWGRMLLQEWLAVSSSYFSSIHWMSKKEQYQYLLEKMPQLVQRLSMRDLSAWLDITPQSLSRIRADIY